LVNDMLRKTSVVELARQHFRLRRSDARLGVNGKSKCAGEARTASETGADRALKNV
jgi:hypothetical protein